MDKITEKFGSFDLLVTTFPGAYLVLLLKNFYEFFEDIASSPKGNRSFFESIFSILDFSPCLPRSIYEFVTFSFLTNLSLNTISVGIVSRVLRPILMIHAGQKSGLTKKLQRS